MKRALLGRPLCLLCIGWILVLWICSVCGLPVFGEPAFLTDPGADSLLSGAVHVSGTITERRIRDDYSQYVLSDASLITSDRTISLKNVLVTSYNDDFAALSARVEWIGELSEIESAGNPGQFDAKSYYACKNIYYRMLGTRMIPLTDGGGLAEFLQDLRDACTQQLQRLLPEDSAGILCAMLFGEKDLLTESSRADYQSCGMMHMLCISGLHISLLGLAVFELLKRLRLPIPLSAILAILLLILYGLLVGGPVSAVRAILMFSVSLGAKVFRKSYDLLSALSLAAILLLVSQPRWLFSCSFQLSFSAVLGIGLVRPILAEIRILQLQKEEKPPVTHRTGRLRKWRGRLLSAIRSGLLNWLAIQLATLPILLWHYFEFPLWSCVLNLLLLPAAGFLMASGLAGCLLAFLFFVPARILLLPAGLLLGVFSHLMGLLRSLPCTTLILGQPALWQVFLWYLGLAILLLWLFFRKQARHQIRLRKRTSSLFLPDAGAPVLSLFSQRKRRSSSEASASRANCFLTDDPDGDIFSGSSCPADALAEDYAELLPPEKAAAGRTPRELLTHSFLPKDSTLARKRLLRRRRLGLFHRLLPLPALCLLLLLFLRLPHGFLLTALDVGQGDSLVLELADGRAFLVDGGSSSVNSPGQYRILPFLKQQGISHLEAIFLSHPDSDHMNGIEELLEMVAADETSLTIGRLLLPAWLRESAEGDDLRQLAKEAAVPISYLSTGDTISCQSLQIRVLHPEISSPANEGNAGSMVLQITYGEFSALLTGDLEGEGEEEVLPLLEQVDVLKVAHHGSRNSGSDLFYSIVSPSLCLISAPEHSTYNHPHPETIERIENVDADWLQTGLAGAIRVETDGERMWVSAWREE